MLSAARFHVPALSVRDKDLLHLLARGHTPTEIADKIGVSHEHMREILDTLQERLGARTHAGLRLRLILQGGR